MWRHAVMLTAVRRNMGAVVVQPKLALLPIHSLSATKSSQPCSLLPASPPLTPDTSNPCRRSTYTCVICRLSWLPRIMTMREG